MASTISATEKPNMQQVDLTQLSVPQLSALKQQLDQVIKDNLKMCNMFIKLLIICRN